MTGLSCNDPPWCAKFQTGLAVHAGGGGAPERITTLNSSALHFQNPQPWKSLSKPTSERVRQNTYIHATNNSKPYTRTKQPELCKSAESTYRVAISTRGQNNQNCANQQRAPTELRSLHADKTTKTVQISREHRQSCDLYSSMVFAPPSKKDNTYKRTTLHGTSKRPPTKFVSSLHKETGSRQANHGAPPHQHARN